VDRIRVLATVLTACGVGFGALLRAGTPPPPNDVALGRLVGDVEGRVARELSVPDATRRQLNSDELVLRAYEAPDEPPVWFFVDYHRTQRLGATIHSPRICYPGSGWSVERADVSAPSGPDAVCRLDLRRGEERMAALYWYESRWGSCAREVTLKAHIVRSAIARRPSDAALVRLSTPVVDGDRDAAHDRLWRFREAVGSVLDEALPLGESPG
jgi:EpsI family protein